MQFLSSPEAVSLLRLYYLPSEARDPALGRSSPSSRLSHPSRPAPGMRRRTAEAFCLDAAGRTRGDALLIATFPARTNGAPKV